MLTQTGAGVTSQKAGSSQSHAGFEIKAMPMGMNTLVGDMGTVLSGGQKQRVLLARALYKRPKILFLDDATSHLDISKEYEVNAAVKALNITRIIIAHRPETITSANRVIVLHDGKVMRDSAVTDLYQESAKQMAVFALIRWLSPDRTNRAEQQHTTIVLALPASARRAPAASPNNGRDTGSPRRENVPASS